MVLKIPNAASEQSDLPLINSWKALLWASLSLPYWRQVLAAKQFISVHKNNQVHPLCKVWSPRVGSCLCCLAKLNPAWLTGVKTSSFAPGTNLRVSPHPKSDSKAPRTSPLPLLTLYWYSFLNVCLLRYTLCSVTSDKIPSFYSAYEPYTGTWGHWVNVCLINV